jgi:hypothetical protein
LSAFAWHLINEGSKQWQRSWEKHVEELEKEITGCLYNTTSNKWTWSVSKINGIMSSAFVLLWFLLGLGTIIRRFPFFSQESLQPVLDYLSSDPTLSLLAYVVAIIFIVIIFCISGVGLTKSSKKPLWYKITTNE